MVIHSVVIIPLSTGYVEFTVFGSFVKTIKNELSEKLRKVRLKSDVHRRF